MALGFEAVPLLKKLKWSHWAALFSAAAGLVAQTAYLMARSRDTALPPLLNSTHDWLLVLAWLIVLLYLVVELADRRIALGLFVLPLVLALVGASRLVSDVHNPSLGESRNLGMFHAAMLVLGMAGVFIGFVMSLMYLVQHRRLKSKRGELPGLHMLSLETLGRVNWWAVVLSVPLLTAGMATGVWLTFLPHESTGAIELRRFEFLISGLLWLTMVALFFWLLTSRRPGGRVVAWRTMWACGFMLVTLVLLQVLSGGGIHGTG